MDFLYDVAISFFSRDELLAVRLFNEVSKDLRVFVYSKRQEELAGTDGLESFRKAFLSDSRLVVVLYRDGWGKTRWTGVEELAIRDRLFDGGWESLLFVTLDGQSTFPIWLPKTHIRLAYGSYGDALTGAIKMRAQELGSVPKVETAVEKAQRVQSNELIRAERERLLTAEGSAAVQKEYAILKEELEKTIADVKTHLTTLKLEHRSDGRTFGMRTNQIGLNFCLATSFPVTKSRIIIGDFDAPVILPGEQRMFIPGEGPRKISGEEFYFDYQHAYGWCWLSRHKKGVFTTSKLAEHLIKHLLELHEQFKDGKRVRHRGEQEF